MTWIITLGLADRAVQVSDRRFTWSDGSLFDDYANKGVCLACADARFTFSYTGLAFVGSPERRTDKWLLDALVEMQAGTKAITTVVTTLEAKATEVLRSTGGDASTNDLTLVGVGLHASGDCVYVKISNAIDDDGYPVDSLRDHCTARWCVSQHNADPARVRLLAIDGYETAAMDVQQRLTALLDAGFFTQSPTPTVVDALVEAVRHASDSDDAHGRIGKIV
jgi:hypothetical protein